MGREQQRREGDGAKEGQGDPCHTCPSENGPRNPLSLALADHVKYPNSRNDEKCSNFLKEFGTSNERLAATAGHFV